jgi:hypothetical protein
VPVGGTFYPDTERCAVSGNLVSEAFVDRCGFFYTNGQERSYQLAQTGLGRVRWIVYQDTCHDAQPVWDSDQIIPSSSQINHEYIIHHEADNI